MRNNKLKQKLRKKNKKRKPIRKRLLTTNDFGFRVPIKEPTP